MEKMTKPANMLVKELMQQTMTESLYGRDKAQGSHCHAYINPLSTRHTLSRGIGGGGVGARGGVGWLTAILHPAGAQRLNTFILTRSLKMAVSFSCFKIFGTRAAISSPTPLFSPLPPGRTPIDCFCEPIASHYFK